MLVLPGLALAVSALARAGKHERDILGLLDSDSDTKLSPGPAHTALDTAALSRSSASQSVERTLAPSLSPVGSTTTSASPTAPTNPPEPTAINTVLGSTSSLWPASAESRTDHSNKTWQIIGIVIIAVFFIAASITCAMFFDRLWRFLKDVVCCTSHPLASEEFVPDCEKQSWDIRTPSPSPFDWNYHKGESLHEACLYTMRPRELPWNIDTQHWNTLHRHPSQRNDHTFPT